MPQRVHAVLALLPLTLLLNGCAGQECNFHSECGEGFYCDRGRCGQDCRADFDCGGGQICDEIGRCIAGVRSDAGPPMMTDGGMDGGMLPVDAGPQTDAGADGGPPTPDAGPTLGRYLDRCVADGDCTSGRCVDDIGGTRMCTVTCARDSQCASEQVCASGVCQRDDTGTACSNRAGCALELCVGDQSMGLGECTRTCTNATDCPAGFACSMASGVFICVDIELGCAQCSTGLCLGTQGCTSTCRTAADCPVTLPGMPYTCSGGVCTPSSFILGPDPIGATCRMSGTATLCRSGACITDDVTGADLCTQRCTESGGCGPGFGCAPVSDGSGGSVLVCLRAGTNALGQPCARGAECDSGICDTSGICTRLCSRDGFCPTGLRCAPAAGLGVSLCTP